MADRDLSQYEGRIQGRDLLDLNVTSTKFVKTPVKVFGVPQQLSVPGYLHNIAED